MFLLSLLLLVPLISCYEFIEPNVGHDCQPGETGTASIKYYFDKDENTYFPFYYKGCGGDPFNRYDNESSGPRIMDMSTCPGIPVSKGSCNTGKGGVVMRHPNGTEESMNKEVKCPTGHYCVETWPFGSGHGFCCNTANKEASKMDYAASKCAVANLKPVNKGDSLLVGRKCEHNFCPSNSTCKQGTFVAYCSSSAVFRLINLQLNNTLLQDRMAPSFLIFLLILGFVHSHDEEEGFFKFYEPDLGRDCQPGEEGIEPGIKYYYDEADMTYFPFWYKGCGGDPENRFDEPSGSSLDIPDHYVCPGIPRSHSACKTGNSREEEEKCSEGYYCQQGWEWRFGSSSGDCCSEVNQKLALQDWEASKCKEEGLRPVVSKELRRGVAILMGRKCEHNFCPPHLSSCRQGNFRAYCCRNKIKDIF